MVNVARCGYRPLVFYGRRACRELAKAATEDAPASGERQVTIRTGGEAEVMFSGNATLLEHSRMVARSHVRPFLRGVAATTFAIWTAACASTGGAPDRGTVDAAMRSRGFSGIRVEGTAPLPPDTSIDDGLTSQEAVAIALWNSPSFQATLADLGIARADLVKAGLLRNPVFSLLFPWGPKQLEWTLQFPFDALWQRPRRVAAAQLNAQAV